VIGGDFYPLFIYTDSMLWAMLLIAGAVSARPYDLYGHCRDVRELIVGVMVAGDSPAMTRRAVEGFFNQTYPSKALVVVNSGPTYTVHDLHPCVIELTGITSNGWYDALYGGGLRNIGMANVPTGAVVVVWSDTVWRPPTALEKQHSYMVKHGLEGCTLQYQTYFYPGYNSSTLFDGDAWGIANGVMARNNARLQQQLVYPDIPWGDDEVYLTRLTAILDDQFSVMPGSDSMHYELVWGEDEFYGAYAMPRADAWCQTEQGEVGECSPAELADHRMLSDVYPPNLLIFE